jgi:hypothetical protein
MSLCLKGELQKGIGHKNIKNSIVESGQNAKPAFLTSETELNNSLDSITRTADGNGRIFHLKFDLKSL